MVKRIVSATAVTLLLALGACEDEQVTEVEPGAEVETGEAMPVEPADEAAGGADGTDAGASDEIDSAADDLGDAADALGDATEEAGEDAADAAAEAEEEIRTE